jgi:WD40 repeat protein
MLVSLIEEIFASGSLAEIKIWSIKLDFECIKTIKAKNGWITFLNLLGNGFMVSGSESEFKICDVNNYESLKTYHEDSEIKSLIVAKNHNIITTTSDKKVNF